MRQIRTRAGEAVTPPGAADRFRQVRRLLQSEGPAGVAVRVLNRATDALTPAGYGNLPVNREDLAGAYETLASGAPLPEPAPWSEDEPLKVAWVCGPPGEGSGGHTTMFRMVDALERSGHTCIIYIHDRHGWEIEQHCRTIRAWWPWVKAEVRDLADGIEDAQVVLATSWETVYPILGSRAKGRRCYFVQDFEPSFYPSGSTAMLAEATYRFGFHGVTAGGWLADLLQGEYGMSADHFDFGCDLEHYRLDPSRDTADERAGICYFCCPSKPRRAHELAVVALDLFAARHPEVPIHTFGEPAGTLPFRVVDHGLLTPDQLGSLYRRSIAGLVLSATNVSLVPHEMLAAGCIPVVNDAEHNRVVLDNDHVAYAPPTPFGLANALSALVSNPRDQTLASAREAAESVGTTTWEASGRQMEQILRRVASVSTFSELVA